MLSTKVINLKDATVMGKKVKKLLALPKTELQTVAVEVRAELNQPQITDVLTSTFVKKSEIVEDILFSLSNSVLNNFKTICKNG